MKFRIALKDPDGFYEGVERAAEKATEERSRHLPSYLSGDEYAYFVESTRERLNDFINKWVDGEYVTLEFDTDANTCTVTMKH